MYNIIIGDLLFSWDEEKSKKNLIKHGISFEEATEVFGDYHAKLYDDPFHSDDEERFIILGLLKRGTICVVCHCYRENESVIRIISARKATKNEEKEYWR